MDVPKNIEPFWRSFLDSHPELVDADYEDSDRPLPYIDALSVVENGRQKPVCMVRTTWVDVVPFGEVDAEFAYEYGEADGTLEGWRKMIREYYSEDRVTPGRKMSEDTPMVCERIEIVHP